MSTRFLNPFKHGPGKTKNASRAFSEEPVGPLDPLPTLRRGSLQHHHRRTTELEFLNDMLSAVPPQSFLDFVPSLEANGESEVDVPDQPQALPSRKYCDVAVQTEAPSAPEESTAPRKGSSSKWREAKKMFMNGRGFQYVVKLVKSRRSSARVSSVSSQCLDYFPTPPASKRAAPPRPPRPDVGTDFVEVLEYAGRMSHELSAPPSLLEAHSPPGTGQAANSPQTAATSLDIPVQENQGHISVQFTLRPSDGQGAKRVIGFEQSKIEVSPEVGSCDFWDVVQRNQLCIPHFRATRWLTGGLLGDGGFGRVYLVKDTATRQECAMKIINIRKHLTEPACRGIANELRVLEALGAEEGPTPFLLKPRVDSGLWAWRSRPGYLHILTEVCAGGELAEYRQLTYPEVAHACAELVRILFLQASLLWLGR